MPHPDEGTWDELKRHDLKHALEKELANIKLCHMCKEDIAIRTCRLCSLGLCESCGCDCEDNEEHEHQR